MQPRQMLPVAHVFPNALYGSVKRAAIRRNQRGGFRRYHLIIHSLTAPRTRQ